MDAPRSALDVIAESLERIANALCREDLGRLAEALENIAANLNVADGIGADTARIADEIAGIGLTLERCVYQIHSNDDDEVSYVLRVNDIGRR